MNPLNGRRLAVSSRQVPLEVRIYVKPWLQTPRSRPVRDRVKQSSSDYDGRENGFVANYADGGLQNPTLATCQGHHRPRTVDRTEA